MIDAAAWVVKMENRIILGIGRKVKQITVRRYDHQTFHWLCYENQEMQM